MLKLIYKSIKKYRLVNRFDAYSIFPVPCDFYLVSLAFLPYNKTEHQVSGGETHP